MAKQKSTLSPVERETVIAMVARRIESLVRSGDLGRGSRLPSEPRLAEMLQVSRASLREALKGMVFLGLLKARPGDGTYLQPSLNSMASRHLQWMLLLHEIKYIELYELREILEPAAAALAARRATSEDLDRMRAALNGMRAASDDPEAFILHEMEFHNAITRAAKNGAMRSTMQMLYGALSEGRHRVLPHVRDIAEHCARHERMFQLIANRDVQRARRAVIADVKYAESLLHENLQDLERTDPRKVSKKIKKTMLTEKSQVKPVRKTATKRAKSTTTTGDHHE
jgi:GntR family transcriptional regulator, transcriptional repressor for pyruvate dehydrogenase complex